MNKKIIMVASLGEKNVYSALARSTLPLVEYRKWVFPATRETAVEKEQSTRKYS